MPPSTEIRKYQRNTKQIKADKIKADKTWINKNGWT